MAAVTKRRIENGIGALFVDSSCINCGTCRHIAPELFHEVADGSAVYFQPQNKNDWGKAFQAIVSCPTNSIGTTEKHPGEMQLALQSFPMLIKDDVYYCGFASKESYGASSYLVRRKAGNILVDSPRFNLQLVRQIENLGGVSQMFLTHRDDVADHKLFHKHFGCKRIIHEADVTFDTQDVEIKIAGDDVLQLATDLIAIPTPGHTKGHMVLLYKKKFLFTGDHIAAATDGHSLMAFTEACWYSWPRQIESIKKLLDFEFEWILPGHGMFCKLPIPEMKRALKQLIN